MEELSVEELGEKEGEARGKMESDGTPLVFPSAPAQGDPVQGAAGSQAITGVPGLDHNWRTCELLWSAPP